MKNPNATWNDFSTNYFWIESDVYFQPKFLCSSFQPNLTAVATGLSFIKTIWTRSECNFPILMENNKNHQITLPKGRLGFSSIDVVDRDEPKYQTPSPYELTNAIRETSPSRSLLISWTMKNKPKPKWLHWDKNRKTYDQNYRNTELML